MKRSLKRILTTHAGRLERPEAITKAMEQHPGGRPTDAAFAGQLKQAVAEWAWMSSTTASSAS